MTSAGNPNLIKVVVTRNLGLDVMPILLSRPDLDSSGKKTASSIGVGFSRTSLVLLRCWWFSSLRRSIKQSWMRVWILSSFYRGSNSTANPAGPSLRIVSTMSVGYDHVDLPELAKRDIKLGYTPDVLTAAAADLSVMLALMAGRNAGQMISLVKDNQWPTVNWEPFAFCGPQLSTTFNSPKRTVGFIGFGRISQATLARLIPFGITSCIYTGSAFSTPTPERDQELAKRHGLEAVRRVDLDELAKESDIVFVLAPGGPATRHLINEEFLRKMKKTSVLVNTSRGTLVDSDALAKALREKWIWGAGIDVVEGEPNVTENHPLVKEPRCIVLPHVATATFEARLGMATLAAKNLLAGLDGENMPASLDLKAMFK